MKHKKNSLKNQKGQSLVEYLIIVAIVGIGSIAITRSVGQNINVKMAMIVRGLGGTVDGDAKLEADKVSKSAYQKKDFTNFLAGSRSGKSKDPQQDNQDDSEDKL